MDNTEALLAELERRGIRVTLHPDGRLTAGPPKKVTDSDLANLKLHKPDIIRLLTERPQGFRPRWYQPPRAASGPHPKDSAIRKNSDCPPQHPGFSGADTRVVSNITETLDASLVSVGPPRQHTPAAPAAVSPAASEGKQPSLFASNPPHEAPHEPGGVSTEPVKEQPTTDASSAAEPPPKPEPQATPALDRAFKISSDPAGRRCISSAGLSRLYPFAPRDPCRILGAGRATCV